jgi:hypothetical protein
MQPRVIAITARHDTAAQRRTAARRTAGSKTAASGTGRGLRQADGVAVEHRRPPGGMAS